MQLMENWYLMAHQIIIIALPNSKTSRQLSIKKFFCVGPLLKTKNGKAYRQRAGVCENEYVKYRSSLFPFL